MTIKTQQVKIYPNRTMTKEIDKLFNYHRYCCNLSLETWNRMYQKSKEADDKHLLPNNTKVIRLLGANSNHLRSECVKEGKLMGKECIE